MVRKTTDATLEDIEVWAQVLRRWYWRYPLKSTGFLFSMEAHIADRRDAALMLLYVQTRGQWIWPDEWQEMLQKRGLWLSWNEAEQQHKQRSGKRLIAELP